MPLSDPPAGATETLIARANALHDLGRHEAAIDAFLQARISAPDDIQVLGGLASCYSSLGDLTEALRYADRAIAAEPKEEWGQRLRGTILLRLGEIDAAVAAARASVRLAPGHAPVYPLLIAALLTKAERSGGRIGLDQTGEAEAVARQALALDPNTDLAHELLSLAAQARQDWLGAERHARAALALVPDSASALCLLGQALARQKRLHEAAATFQQASRIDPKSQTARHNFMLDTLRAYPLTAAALALPWLALGGFLLWRIWRLGLLVGPISALWWMVPILPVMLSGFLLSLRRFMVFKGLPLPTALPPSTQQRRDNAMLTYASLVKLSTVFLGLSALAAFAAGLVLFLPDSGSKPQLSNAGMDPKLACILAAVISVLCLAVRYLSLRRLRELMGQADVQDR